MSFSQNKFETIPNVHHEGLVFNILNKSFHKIDFVRGRTDLKVGEGLENTREYFALRAWTLEKGEVQAVQVNLNEEEMKALALGLYKYIVGLPATERETDDNEDDDEGEGTPDMAFKHNRGEGWRHVSIPVRRRVVEEEKKDGNPTVGFLRIFRENEKTEELYGASGSVDGQPLKIGGAASAADAIRMFGNAADATKKLAKDRAEGTTPHIEPDIQKPEQNQKGTQGSEG